MQYILSEEEFMDLRNRAIGGDARALLYQNVLTFETAFKKIVALEDSEGDDPLDEAIMIAKRAINWAGDE